MAAASASRWRRLRVIFRICRITLLLLVLALVCAFVYLNVAGLPEPLSRALRAEFAARGLVVDFATLRLNWNWSLLAEQVQVRSARDRTLHQLNFGELLVRLRWWEALRARIEVTAVTFRDGRLTTNLAPSPDPPEVVTVEGLGGSVRFLPGDRWELDSFRGRVLGASFSAFGSITNAFKLSHALAGDRQPPAETAAPPAPGWAARLRPMVRAWGQLKFIAPPEIRVRFGGDAARPETFNGDVRVTVAGAVATWGEVAGLDLTVALDERSAPGLAVFRGTLGVEALRSPWVECDHVHVDGQLGWAQGATTPQWIDLHLTGAAIRRDDLALRQLELNTRTAPRSAASGRWQTELRLSASQSDARGMATGEVTLNATFTHDRLQRWPDAGQCELAVARLRTAVGRIETLRTTADFEHRGSTVSGEDTEAPAWLRPWKVNLHTEADAIEGDNLRIASLKTDVGWESPRLALTNTVAALGETTIEVGSLTFDLRTRLMTLLASVRGQGLQTVAPWLPAPVRAALAEVSLPDPLSLKLEAHARLPAPLTRAAFTSAEFRRSLVGTTDLQTGPATWRGIEVEAGELKVRYGDGQAVLDKLLIRRPEGALTVQGSLDLTSLEYHGTVESSVLPQASAPVLGKRGTAAFRIFEFHRAPLLDARFAGRGADLTALGAVATIACPDFAVRGQALQRLSAAVIFTNLFVSARDIEVFHGSQRAGAGGLGFDVRTHRLHLTNATADIDPLVVATAIGTNVVKAIENYRFLQPPRAVVNGSLITKGRTNHADLRFELDGGAFEYWRFRVPRVNGTVLWQEETVTVTNLLADFYEGRLNLHLQASLLPRGRANLAFNAGFHDADLRKAVADLVPGTTNLDGTVSGRLTITQLLTDDWKSWQGDGEAQLRDGYLWDLPLFTVLSDFVNTIVPGAGKAKASAGTCTFDLTNSVLSTKDLRIEARPLRLAGRGTVDFEANTNLDIEAEILPGIPLVGPLLNLAILPVAKALTYRVTGTLGNPRVQPLYVPKPLSTLLNLGRTPKPTNSVATPKR